MRRVLAFLIAVGATAAAAGLLWSAVGHGDAGGWYERARYPLEHAATIRRAAERHHVDPALVAAVIYAESRFDERARSSQGAVGLMQLLPDTAAQIARETGGVAFLPGDLEDAGVNVRYGCYYLRRVLDLFDGNTLAAVAAYNAGAGAVARWADAAAAEGHPLRLSDIPYTETRAYVSQVLELRRVYRDAYGEQLGLAS